MKIKKLLSMVLAMVMVVSLMPATAMASVTTSNGNQQLTKKAEWINQESGLAKITLEVKGSPIVTPKKGADVVVVMDYSGSMEEVISSETHTCGKDVTWTYWKTTKKGKNYFDVYTGVCPDGHTHQVEVPKGQTPPAKICDVSWTVDTTRWQASKNALATLLDQVIPTSQSENKVAAVAFDSDVRSGYTNDFTNDKASIITTINNLVDPHPSSPGAPIAKGTNYVKALQTAYNYINNRSDKTRDAYVVFLSDGEPNTGYEGEAEIANLKSKGVTIYTVGLALDKQSAIDRLRTYATKPEFFKNIKTEADLDNAFADIGKTIASGVTIWDTIDTQYFSVTKKPGQDIYYEASNGNDKVQFTNDKDFVWDFDNFSVAGETLVIYIQLKSEYLNTNTDYPTNTPGGAYGQYVGEQGTNVNLPVTENEVSSAVPRLGVNKPEIYAVTGTIDNGGRVTNGTQNVTKGSSSEAMVFTAATGYHISNIKVNGADQSLEGITTSYTYPAQTVTAPITVQVITDESDVLISYQAGNGGTVTRDTESIKGITGTPQGATAVPNPGFHFVNWTYNDDEVGTEETFVPSKGDSPVYIERIYKANFAEDEKVTIHYEAKAGGSVSLESEELLPSTGKPLGSMAEADQGYTFFNWTNSQGVEVGTSYIFVPSKVQGVYVADTYSANFKPKYHNFVVENIYQDLLGGTIDSLHTIAGNGSDEKVPFNSEISSAKNGYLRGYEYSDMIVYVDEEIASDSDLSELGITVDRINGTLTGNLPDHQIWVKYIYDEVEKYNVDYTSEGIIKGSLPPSITDALPGDEITVSTQVPLRDGFDFMGWTPMINGDPIQVTDGKFIMPAGDVEIRASWKPNQETFDYIVKYYTTEGNLIATVPSKVLKSNPVVTTVEDKTPEGYRLQGYEFGEQFSTELNAEITENGQIITVYYEKNDLIVKHVYGSKTVYDSKQSKARLSAEDGKIVVNAVMSGRYTKIIGTSLNNESLGKVTSVTVIPNGESKYEVVFTYGARSSSDDDSYTPGDDVTIIEDPDVALEDSLEKIDHFAYVFGYEDGTVRPENKVSREEITSIFYRLLKDSTRDELFTRSQNFPDVASNRWSNVSIATLLKCKIISGYPNGEFKPGNNITRAEFATIVSKFDDLSYSGKNQFNDIDGHWAANYINSAALKGWISGYPDGSFHPDAYITRAEAITLINAVLGRQVNKEGLLPDAKYWSDNKADKWYYEAVMEATNSHDYEIAKDSKVEKWTAMKDNKVWTER